MIFSHRYIGLLTTLLVVIAIRLLIYVWLYLHGYFYGIPWDSFSRTMLSYEWSQHPYFAPSDGYWLPLQFWLTGSIYYLIRFWNSTSDIVVPVVINNVFFIGSIIIIYLFTYKITGEILFAFLACLIASIFAGDVFVTYTALSEPILIFLMLLSSYLFYDLIINNKNISTKSLLWLTVAVFFASATHYIGWFLAIFIVIFLFAYLFEAIVNKKKIKVYWIIIGIMICGLMPSLWLLNNYLIWGNPLRPIQFAKQMQQPYIGQMSLFTRFLITPKVIVKEFYPIAIPGFLALIFLVFKKPKVLLFTLPTIFVLGMIWLSTWFALSAPYQEPRYLVFICWTLIPIMAIVIYYVWKTKIWPLRIFILSILLLILCLNIQGISSFKNSFDNNVKIVAYLAKDWFTVHPGSGRIFINQDSFAETGVIPVISGYPDRIILLSNNEINEADANPIHFFEQKASVWMCITKNKSFAMDAKQAGLVVNQKGVYYLIQPID